MKCKDCKYFVRGEELGEPRNTCESDKFVECDDIEAGIKDGVTYGPMYDIGAVLYVGEDFGCIHFEKSACWDCGATEGIRDEIRLCADCYKLRSCEI